MFLRGLRTLSGFALMAVALACQTQSANADAADDQYLAAARSLGVTAPPDQLISAGHAVCDQFDNPGPFFGIAGPPRW